MRRPAWVLMAVAVAVLAGCARSRVLVHVTPATSTTRTAPSSPAPASPTPTPSPSSKRYLAQLRAEERTLAAAERRIPTNAPTPQALSRSASLLSAAVSRLARGLAAINPPPAVARDHAQLVGVARAYAGELGRAAALARRPGAQVQAGSLLESATTRASAAFGASLSKIYSTLGVRQP